MSRRLRRFWMHFPWLEWLRTVPMLAMALFVAACGLSWAEDAGSRDVPDLHVSTFVDETAELTLADILADGEAIRFTPSAHDGIGARYSRAAVWLKILMTPEQTMPALMALSPNFVDMIDVYLADLTPDLGVDDFTHIALGAHRPLSSSGYSGLDEVVPLSFIADRTKVAYIRVASPNVTLLLNVRLYRPEAHVVKDAFVSIVGGIVLGSMCLLLITQLILFQFDRNPIYLLLALSTLSAAAYHMGSLGYSRLLLFAGGGTGNDIFLAFFSSFGLTAGALTTWRVFDLRDRRSWMLWTCAFVAVAGLVCTIAIFFGLNLQFAPLRNLLIQIFVTITAGYSLWTIRRGDWASYLRAAAFVSLWMGLTLMLLYYSNVPGLPEWASKGYAIACLLEAMLLTLMLSWRLRMANRLNAALQEEALLSARNAEQRAIEIARERTRELAEAKQTAEAALAAEMEHKKNQVRFMEVISHQYRTPLASIRSSVDTIELSLAADDEPNRQRIKRIRRGIARLVEVLEINLGRSRIQGSALEPQFCAIRIAPMISDIGRRARELMPGAAFQIDIPPEEQDVEIDVDSHMLSLALINLLENAVKYSTPTGEKPVTLSVAVDGPLVAFSVKDEGIGIPASEIESVSKERIRGSNTAKIEGTGLGLSLVTRIAAAHGGRLEIESIESMGTRVTILLPRAQRGSI